ncbi:hypothetical protein IFM89_036649 [Coptis chinensis]|uniref:R13L1/DRL21-like LRR repeat region domain-containing protein n=1 Tax=Coptis chinensis TaxID=261450 RepID=A0A835IGG1_9MAGN|nr:hypothetical protein IFM89_036649 [Coptis chinensis]
MPVGIGQLTCLETLSMFAVCSSTECAGIQELERLNQIKGELSIKGLGHVCNQKDAEQANLRNKKRLAKLNLWWSGGDDQEGVDPLHENISKEVLEGLHPHSNIQELQIQGYPVWKFQWLIFSSWLPFEI